jgi:hypothetical protein
MKMGTTCSPFPYDVVADQALQSANLRRPAILRFAHGRMPSRFRRVVRFRSIAAFRSIRGLDEMCQKQAIAAKAGAWDYYSGSPAILRPS